MLHSKQFNLLVSFCRAKLIIFTFFCSLVSFGQTNLELKSSVNRVQPMTGIVFWADNTGDLNSLGNKIQLEYSYLIYSDVVQSRGQYDWGVVDDLLSTAASRGRQVILRFRYTYPGITSPSVPNYIRNSSGYKDRTVSVEGSSTYVPDWSSSELQSFTLEFFTKFAARYDKDPRLAIVQIGFGSYSEYHLYGGPLSLGNTFPSKGYQTTFLNHVNSAFDELQWTISIDAADSENTPFAGSSALRNLNFGLFDDSFLYKEHSSSNSEYNRSSWLTFGSNRANTKIAGGEFSYFSDYDQKNVLNLPNGPHGTSYEEMAALYDISYMIGNDQLSVGQSASRIQQAGINSGYNFKVTAYSTSGSRTSVTISNTGLAPIYYDAYPTVGGTRSSTSLKGLIAGQSRTFTINDTPDGSGLSIECDRLVSGQVIQYDADLDGSSGPTNILTVSSLSTYSTTGGSKSIAVTSNVNWTARENTSWISLGTTSGSNNGSVAVNVSANTSTSSRSATVTISGGNITRSVTVSQAGADDDPGNDNDNLALNGSASQSSTVYNGPASRAIDGNTNGVWRGGSVTHTAATTGSWWEVELAEQASIDNIVIYNRTDSCCRNRLSNFTVRITNINGNTVFSQRITQAPNPSVTINAGGATGDTVRITTNLTNTALSLAEVEVYGESDGGGGNDSCTAGSNVAEGASIVEYSNQQSAANGVANVIDGNASNRWSANGFPQSVVFDMGDVYDVNQVNLYPYKDRAYQFKVQGSATSPNNGYSTLRDATNNTAGGSVITRTFNTYKVRYIRLTITGASGYSGSWSSIEEFEVICAGTNITSNTIVDNNVFKVAAYPSPFTDSIHLTNETNQAVSVKLLDLTGKIVATSSVVGTEASLKNLNVDKGIYLLQVFDTNDKLIKVIKVVK